MRTVAGTYGLVLSAPLSKEKGQKPQRRANGSLLLMSPALLFLNETLPFSLDNRRAQHKMLSNKTLTRSTSLPLQGECASLSSIYASDAYPKHGYHLVTPSP